MIKKIFNKIILIIGLIVIINFIATTSFATTDFNICNFHINKYNATAEISNIVLSQTVDEKTLIDGKIAPGTSGSFDIIVSADKEIQADFIIKFDNFLNSLPTNLKFYYNNEECNLKETILEDNIISTDTDTKKVYTIKWVWEYETKDDAMDITNEDIADTQDGKNIDRIDFNIVFSTSYINNSKVLPRTGDTINNQITYVISFISVICIAIYVIIRNVNKKYLRRRHV